MKIADLRDELIRLADAEDSQGLVSFISTFKAEILLDFQAAWDAGWSLSRVGRPEDGIPLLERAMDMNPDDARGSYGLALAKLAAADRLMQEAVDLLRTSIGIKDSWGARYALAVQLLKSERGDEGEALLREAVKSKPDSKIRLEEFADYLDDRGKLQEAQELRDQAVGLD